MKQLAIDIGAHFEELKGQRPWRARLGHGSFLTFDFGPKVAKDGHRHGAWRLWIYLSNWVLTHNGRQLATSDSNRHQIELAVRRLESVPFTGIGYAAEKVTTLFRFEDFHLSVSPADYIEKPNQRDEYYFLFMPGDVVLTVGPGGVHVGPANA